MGFQSTFQERVIPAGNRAFGETATLTIGEHLIEGVTVQWEDRSYELMDSAGFATSFNSRDFMFDVADAYTQGQALEPRSGMRVKYTENGKEVEFEATPLGRMPAAGLEPGGYRWRVHTKRVA